MLRVLREFSPSPSVFVRMIADAVMLAMALLAAFVIRFLWLVQVQRISVDSSRVLDRYIGAYWQNLLIVTLISLPLFLLFGFYTRGRYYQSRYKVVVVAQAVTISYLVLAFASYAGNYVIFIPRGVWLLGWLFSLGLLTLARGWSAMWRRISTAETARADARTGTLGSSQHPRVLVIGGAGYIGSALLPILLRNGYRVRLLDLLLFGEGPVSEYLGHPLLEIVKADFREVHQVVRAMAGVDAVVHLGGIVGDPACALDEDLTLEVNLVATRMIAEIAKGHGVQRFVFASTCSVYGAGDEVLDERSALRPVSLYARTKIGSERVLRSLTDQVFQPTVLRFATVYGLSGRNRFDLVVNLLTAKAVTEGQITVYGGAQWRPFVHVEDAARSIFAVMEQPTSVVGGEVFNVGSNEQNYTIEEVAQLIGSIVPSAGIVNMGGDVDERNYRVDFAKIRGRLGFEPVWTVEAGIRQVIEKFEQGEITDYRDPRHSNVQFLREEPQTELVRRDLDWSRLLTDEG